MTRLKILLAASAALLALAGAARAGDSGDTLRPLYACGERIWPGAPLHDLDVILVNQADRTALVFQDPVTPAADRLPPPTPAQIGQMLDRHVRFFVTQVAARQALIVSYDGRADGEVIAAVETAYHEGFHVVGQAGWPAARYDRARKPGLNLGLRYARAELARSLMGLVQGQDAAGAARYWWDQAKAQAGDEAALMNALDRLEGSAEFVARRGLALSVAGCDAPETALADVAAQRLQLSWPVDGVARLVAAPDAESYMIGAAAMLLLQRGQAADWQARVRQGGHPLDLLLDGVKPVAQATDAALRRAIEANAKAARPALQAAVDAVVAHYERDAAWYVAVPATWDSSASFDESGGPATGTTSDHQALSMMLSASGTAQGGPGRLEFRAANVLVVDDTPCGTGRYGLLPLPTDVSIDLRGPGLHYRSPTLSIDLPSAKVRKTVDAQGRTLLCLPPR